MQETSPGAPFSAARGATSTDAASVDSPRSPVTVDMNQIAAQAPTRDDLIAQSNGRLPSMGEKRATDPRLALLQTQCLKLSLSILSRPHQTTRSLGFTSAIPGEGKSLLATLTATSLAGRSHRSITLVDCNWDDPTLHTLFDVPATPGLAEWLRHECDLEQIRHTVSPYLTIIPAGAAHQDGVALTDALKAAGAHSLLAQPDETLIADMASVLTSSYSALLSQQFDAILLVVRAGVTWDSYIQEACQELSASAVEGVVLNATRSRIPRWLQRML